VKDKKKWIIGSVVAFILVIAVALGGGDALPTDSDTTTDISTTITASGTVDSGDDIDTDEQVSDEAPDDSGSGGDSTTEALSDSGSQGGSQGGSVGGQGGINVSSVPAYSGTPFVAINNNVPTFSSAELTTKAYESYSSLDSLGRCGVAIASCGKEIMPKDGEERGSISSIKPSGWVQASYDIVSGGYLYNRCHLIGWQLSAENANNRNLITGTRYMNTEGMLPFENMVADYIHETGNHVAYRVTPIYSGNNLVASGVQLEAYSIEDDGEGICFNVYVYNVQPGITINYATGSSCLTQSGNTDKPDTNTDTGKETEKETEKETTSGTKYVLNTSSKKFHYPDCGSVKQMSDKNRAESNLTRDELMAQGYEPCGNCHP
jgi:DNA-entry nuclease